MKVAAMVAVAIGIIIFQTLFLSSLGKAQTTMQGQPYDYADPCGDRGAHITTSEMRTCALDAIRAPPHHFEYQYKWVLATAEHYDYEYAYHLADIYARRSPSFSFQEGDSGVPQKSLIEAYKWAEIGASIKGQYVRRLPPQNAAHEDNSRNIRQRDEIAKMMTPDEIKLAQTTADQWLARHAAGINRYLSWATCMANSCPDEPIW